MIEPVEWHYSVTSGGTIMGAATVNAAGSGWWSGVEQPCEGYPPNSVQPGVIGLGIGSGTIPLPTAMRHLRSVPMADG